MKKRDFKSLVILGLTGSLMAVASLSAEDAKDAPKDPNAGNVGYKLMTDEDIRLELSQEGTKLYDSLDDKGKELARFVASQRCAGTNRCKGLNACATDKHSCAGKGECKGQSKCGFSDKNLAVKVVYDKLMQEKRELLSK